MMQTQIRYALLLVVILFLSACAARTANYKPTNLPQDSLNTIACDIVPIIAENNPAKSNSFSLYRDDFSKSLARQLGKLGYEVNVSHQPELSHQNVKTIRYTIDWLSPETLYLALSINNTERYTRTYTVAGKALIPDNIQFVGVTDGRK